MSAKQKNNNESLIDDLLVKYIKAIEEIEKNPNLTGKERLLFVVLNVRGTVITGELISFQTYRTEQTRFENLTSAPVESSTSDKLFDNEYHYIHLRNACFLLDSRLTISFPGKGLLWRGRLSSVDGFAIGKLQTSAISDAQPAVSYIAPYKD